MEKNCKVDKIVSMVEAYDDEKLKNPIYIITYESGLEVKQPRETQYNFNSWGESTPFICQPHKRISRVSYRQS